MNILYFDCFSGISGDMFAGAMLDLGADAGKLAGNLKLLGLPGYSVDIRKVLKNGISATDFDVKTEDGPQTHAAGGGHHHRSWSDIQSMIENSGLSAEIRSISLKIFDILAKAESKIHGVDQKSVTFHEVGAVDSIIDIVSAAILIDTLRPDKIIFSPLAEGCGTVLTQHGMLPVPAPATAEILRSYGIPMMSSGVKTELVTPTGAAIAAALSQGFGAMPSMTIRKTGYGCGKKQLENPNVLRAVLGESPENTADSGETDTIAVLETSIDDSTGEALGNCMEELFRAGALDAFCSPVYMKKNRPAWELTVLCRPGEEERFARIIFTLTGSIGLRKRLSERIKMSRSSFEAATKYGNVLCKSCTFHGVSKQKPEYESLKAAYP